MNAKNRNEDKMRSARWSGRANSAALKGAATFVLFMAATVGAQQPPAADMVLINAKVWTGEKDRPAAEAVAVRGGRIVYERNRK